MTGLRVLAGAGAGAGAAILAAALIGPAAAFAAAAAPVPVTTTTTVSVPSGDVHPYQPVTLTATVTSASGPSPIGTVTFTRSKQSLCSGVAVDAATGTATCDVTDRLAVGSTRVKAAFVPTDTAVWTPSTGMAALPVSQWTPTLAASAQSNTAGCRSGQLLKFTVSPPDGSAAAVTNGLPAPSGQINGPLTNGFTVQLGRAGKARLCVPVFTSNLSFGYSGDDNYAAADSIVAIKNPNTTPRGGSGAPPPTGSTPPHAKPNTTPRGGSAAPTLATTGPSIPVAPTLLLGSGLVLLGLALTVAGSGRRWSRRAT